MKFSGRIMTGLLAISMVGMLAGCGSSRKAGFEEAVNPPSWVLNPPQAEDTFYGVGIAQKANPSLAQQTADSRARDAIVRELEVKVANMIRDAMEEVLTTFGPEGNDYTESVSKQVASQTLRGCKIDKREISGKTWYSLASYNVAAAREQILETAKNEARKHEALYKKVLAEQSFDRLDEAVKRLEGSTGTLEEGK